MKRWVPLLVGALMVPATVTAFGFSVYGDELETALSSSPPCRPFSRARIPVSDFVAPLRMEPPAPCAACGGGAGGGAESLHVARGQGHHVRTGHRVVGGPR